MAVTYQTQFGSLDRLRQGRRADDLRRRQELRVLQLLSRSRARASRTRRSCFGQNQIYVLECLRADGASPWYTCAHDEFALVMDGEVEIHLVKLQGEQIVPDAEHNGAVLVKGEPKGAKMGWMKLTRGHQGMLPKNTAYQFKSAKPGVVVLQTCKGDLSIERWAQICQA